MIEIICIEIFVFGYVLIAQEQLSKINKTSISLVVGVILWLLVTVGKSAHIQSSLATLASDIFGLIIFLLSAMTLVEILTHYGFFDFIYHKLAKLHLKDKTQFFMITLLTFCFSSFLDNLTTTIVMVQIARRFFKGNNLLKVGVAIIIAANAGGAFSPIGDVTTTMLWLAGKFNASTIFFRAFVPSLVILFISTFIISRSIIVDTMDTMERVRRLGKIEWIVICLCLLSFSFPILMTFIQLPPYLGLLLGLGIVWFVIDFLRTRGYHDTRLEEHIEHSFQNVDISSLFFIIGILMAIGALRHLGTLDKLSEAIFSSTPTTARLINGSLLIGALSSIFDNIPLTAAALDIVKTTNAHIWVLLALMVGNGGSLLVIGSAPGIITMAMIKDFTFNTYFRIAVIPVLLAVSAGILVWYAQFLLFP